MESCGTTRRLLALALVISLVHLANAQTDAPQMTVPEGTQVEIQLLDNLSSETLRDGQSVAFKVSRDVAVNGATLMPAGMPVSGEVKAVQAAGAWHKAGSFNLIFKPVRLEDGSMVQLDFHRPKLKSTKGETTGNAIGTTLMLTYYFPLIPVALIGGARKGEPYAIRAGERYLVYVVAAPTGDKAAREAAPASRVTESPK